MNGERNQRPLNFIHPWVNVLMEMELNTYQFHNNILLCRQNRRLTILLHAYFLLGCLFAAGVWVVGNNFLENK